MGGSNSEIVKIYTSCFGPKNRNSAELQNEMKINKNSQAQLISNIEKMVGQLTT